MRMSVPRTRLQHRYGPHLARSVSMNIILTGALVGTGVAISLVALEYVLLRRNSAERAKKTRKKDVFDGAERSRMGSLARFCVWIPPAFAVLFWALAD